MAGPVLPDEPGLPGAEAYLEAIYVLSREDPVGDCRAARVAEYLGVSAVSVSRALTRLERRGDIVRRQPQVVLSPQGLRRAEAVVRRHRLAERWLKDRLGLNLVEAHREAERLEHALSERVVTALWDDLGQPTTCPHGNPIPGLARQVVPAYPLAAVPPGAYVVDRLFEQLEGLEDLLVWVEAQGLLPESRLTVEAPGPGPVAVRVGDRGVAVPETVARRVLVRPAVSREETGDD